MKVKSNFSVIEKIHYLGILRKALEKKLRTLDRLRMNQHMYRSCHIAIDVVRIKDELSISYEY